jgi:hypothetical protein
MHVYERHVHERHAMIIEPFDGLWWIIYGARAVLRLEPRLFSAVWKRNSHFPGVVATFVALVSKGLHHFGSKLPANIRQLLAISKLQQ